MAPSRQDGSARIRIACTTPLSFVAKRRFFGFSLSRVWRGSFAHHGAAQLGVASSTSRSWVLRHWGCTQLGSSPRLCCSSSATTRILALSSRVWSLVIHCPARPKPVANPLLTRPSAAPVIRYGGYYRDAEGTCGVLGVSWNRWRMDARHNAQDALCFTDRHYVI